MLAEARKAPTPKETNERLCEAWYILGEVSSWKGDEKKAKEYYVKSVETGETEYIEHGNAKALLSQKVTEHH